MVTTRKGVFVGAFIPTSMKRALWRMARSKHWTLTELLLHIFKYAIKHEADVLKGDDNGE